MIANDSLQSDDTPREPTVSYAHKCSLMSVSQNKLALLKKINTTIFPVPYSETYYKEVMNKALSNYCKFAYFDDIPVGAVTCKLEKDKKGKNVLYIQTLGVLAAFRGYGVGQILLEGVLNPVQSFVIPNEKLDPPAKITKAYLHVQTCNEDAKRFYEKNGFVQTGIEENYYPKLEERHRFLLYPEAQLKGKHIYGEDQIVVLEG